MVGARIGIVVVERIAAGVIHLRCNCGTTFTRPRHEPGRPPKLAGCGCYGIVIGQVFGELKIEGQAAGRHTLAARCTCGRPVIATAPNLLSGKHRSCGHARYGGLSRAESRLNPGIPRWYFNEVRRHARGRGNERPVTITLDYIQELFDRQGGHCAITGESIGFRPVLTASLDRIDSTGGYTPGNVQWVHKVVNLMKLNHSEAELAEWAARIAAGLARREESDAG